ncbi:MAG: DNA-binding response OmpR family regulator, partial [Flavobacteriales bacterium]
QLGADDYLTTPFHLSELAARIFSVIRRKQFKNSNIITQNEIKLDLIAKNVYVHEQKVDLTKTEYDLLLFFMGNKNKVISKNILAEHLSGDFADMLDNHDFIYAHIKNLKKKLNLSGGDSYLKTVYGTGYKWEA